MLDSPGSAERSQVTHFRESFCCLVTFTPHFPPKIINRLRRTVGGGGGPDKVLGVGIYHGLRLGLHGCRSGESAHLPSLWPGSDSRTRCIVWVEFFVGSRTCSEYFFPGSPVFI